MMRVGLAATGLLLALAAPSAQSGGSISGVVVSIDTPPQPVRRAIVSVSGGAIPTNISVVADDRGRFVFTGLASGRYTVRASKAAHLTTTYGATRPGEAGTAIAVTAGQRTDIRIVLPRGAVITGIVRDMQGQPASAVQVAIVPARDIEGSGGFRLSSEDLITDDRGVYRAYGLAPGEYVVSATGRVTGGTEIYMPTAAEIDARLRVLQQQAGGAPLPSPVPSPSTTRPSELAPMNSGPAYGYAPTYYPGTTIAADAARIVVAVGEVREGVDIPLLPVRAARISGTISSGEIPVTRLRPMLTRMGPAESSASSPRLTGPEADGSFSFSGVTPGRYLLVVRTGPGAMMAMTSGRGFTSNNPGVPSRFAMQELSVTGADVSGLTLTLRPALSLSGRIAFDAATLTPPESLKAIRIRLLIPGMSEARPGLLDSGIWTPPSATASEDGTFALAGILPGTYSVAAAVSAGTNSSKWWLRSAIVNGRDILDHPLEIGATTPDVTGAVLTFTDRRSELAGTLLTATGAPASEFIIVIFPADASYWRPGARRLRSTRPGSDGAFGVANLPAGEYLIAALTDVDPDEWQEAEFLRQLVPAAVKIVIRDGEVTRQDLKIAR